VPTIAHLEDGFRGTLEHRIAKDLKSKKAKFDYETIRIKWSYLTHRTYKPDFILSNGIIIEAKGFFQGRERTRALAIRKQHPSLDIRFVFGNSNNKLYTGSKTTYAEWCEENGFKYSDKTIPEEWLKEKGTNKHPKIIKIEKKENL
jgi:hypothetical protein